MSNPTTINMMQRMHLSAMARSYKDQCENHVYREMGFENRVDEMVEAEWLQRKNNRIARLLKNAHLKYRSACLENIEYHEDRKLDRDTIIRLASCNYLEARQNIIIVGATGTGKTWLSCALGYAACRLCHSVRYIRMPELLDDLREARSQEMFRKALGEYIRPKLLIIDEWLTSTLKESESRDILEIVEARNATSSTILCSQNMPEGWHHKISKGTHADAILDRLVHNAHIILIEGILSMRERKGLKNNPG